MPERPSHQDLLGVWPQQHHYHYAHYGLDKGAVVLLVNDDPNVEGLEHGDVVFAMANRSCRKTNVVGAFNTAGVVDLSASPEPTGAHVPKGAETPVRMIGYHSAVKVDGAVAQYEYLHAKEGGVAESGGTDAGYLTIGRALSSFAGPGTGTVEAMLFPILAAAISRAIETYIPFGSEAYTGQAFTPT